VKAAAVFDRSASVKDEPVGSGVRGAHRPFQFDVEGDSAQGEVKHDALR